MALVGEAACCGGICQTRSSRDQAAGGINPPLHEIGVWRETSCLGKAAQELKPAQAGFPGEIRQCDRGGRLIVDQNLCLAHGERCRAGYLIFLLFVDDAVKQCQQELFAMELG